MGQSYSTDGQADLTDGGHLEVRYNNYVGTLFEQSFFTGQ